MKLWIIHKLETSRYTETVCFAGVATSEKMRDEMLNKTNGFTASEIEADKLCDIQGEENFHESPSW